MVPWCAEKVKIDFVLDRECYRETKETEALYCFVFAFLSCNGSQSQVEIRMEMGMEMEMARPSGQSAKKLLKFVFWLLTSTKILFQVSSPKDLGKSGNCLLVFPLPELI